MPSPLKECGVCVCVHVWSVCLCQGMKQAVPCLFSLCRQAFEALETEHAATIMKQLEAEEGTLSHFEALTALAFRCVEST